MFLFKVVLCLIGYYLTFYLNNTKNFGPIKASAFVALPIGILYQIAIYYQFNLLLIKDIAAIMMGATFMGMISNKHQHQLLDFIISSFIFCVLYHHIADFFDGFGGLLGTIACISILSVFGIERILKKI